MRNRLSAERADEVDGADHGAGSLETLRQTRPKEILKLNLAILLSFEMLKRCARSSEGFC